MKPFWVVDEFLLGEDDKIDFSHTLNKLSVDFQFVVINLKLYDQ